MIGDDILFQRADGIEAGWQAVQPFLDAWKNAGTNGIETYRGRQRRPGLRRRAAAARRPQLAEVFVMAAAGQPKLIVVADAEALAQAAAERVMARIAANPGRIAICLTGGSSPKKLYQLLGSDAWRGKIPWDRVHWFIGDERFVPASDPLNNMAVARATFLDRSAPSGQYPPDPDRRPKIRTRAPRPMRASCRPSTARTSSIRRGRCSTWS